MTRSWRLFGNWGLRSWGSEGFPAVECPRCKSMVEGTARGIEAKREMREALFREVGEILEQDWDESSYSVSSTFG